METAKSTLITWQENIALQRYQMIAPLLEADLDDAKKIRRRREIAEEHDVSERTLRRYESAFREGGFNGLKPADRSCQLAPSLPEDFPELVSQAIQLKREVPTRSVNQIIFILEGEGRVEPGILKRSTLQHHLFDAGFGQKQMRKYIEGQKSSSKRFCKPHRMMLLQADIKYGPKLPIGKNGARVQTYLSSIIDDHSRYILDSRFYDNQEKEIVEETFHRAILKHGTFDAAYCDNGKQYVSKQLVRSAAMLGIRIYHARPYSGQSKGKVEKFHQVVDDFIAEARAKKIRTLEELNRYWGCYLEEYYQLHPHDGIREYYESKGLSEYSGAPEAPVR
jgi:putative transposase